LTSIFKITNKIKTQQHITIDNMFYSCYHIKNDTYFCLFLVCISNVYGYHSIANTYRWRVTNDYKQNNRARKN